MTIIIEFPRGKVSWTVRIRQASEPPNVTILPVVRIERFPDEAPRGPGRQSRRRVMEKVRQLQEEMLRNPTT